MAQKLIVSEKGELTIHADNGIIDSKGKHEVKLEGEFVVNAPDLCRLLSRVNEAPLMEVSQYSKWSLDSLSTKTFYSFDKDDIINDMQKIIDDKESPLKCEIERLEAELSDTKKSLHSEIERLKVVLLETNNELSELKSRGLLKRIFCKN